MIPCRSIWVHINGKSTMDNNSNNNIFPASIIISDNNSRWSMALPLWRIVFRTSAITALLPDSSAVTFRDTPVSFLFLLPPSIHPWIFPSRWRRWIRRKILLDTACSERGERKRRKKEEEELVTPLDWSEIHRFINQFLDSTQRNQSIQQQVQGISQYTTTNNRNSNIAS